MRRPIILVPGCFGTTLVDPETGRIVWGDLVGSTLDVIAGKRSPRETMALRPGEVLWSYPIVPRLLEFGVYRDLLRALRRGGYALGDPLAPSRSEAVYPFVYDWRQDVVESARALESLVSAIRERLGVDGVDIVAQSWGCQVARYFLRFGGADMLGERPEAPRPGADAVRTAFLIGPPSGGTIYAYHDLLLGFAPTGKLGKRFAAGEIGLWPCAYQMLRLGPQLVVDEEGCPTGLDPTDLSFWRRFGLGPYASAAAGHSDLDSDVGDAFVEGQLSRSARLAAALSTRYTAEARTRLATYTCDCIPTLTRIVLRKSGGAALPVLDVNTVASRCPNAARTAIEMGDEYVPFAQVRESAPEADVVRDPRHVSDRSFLLLAKARRHRWLVRSRAVLSSILLNAGR